MSSSSTLFKSAWKTRKVWCWTFFHEHKNFPFFTVAASSSSHLYFEYFNSTLGRSILFVIDIEEGKSSKFSKLFISLLFLFELLVHVVHYRTTTSQWRFKEIFKIFQLLHELHEILSLVWFFNQVSVDLISYILLLTSVN